VFRLCAFGMARGIATRFAIEEKDPFIIATLKMTQTPYFQRFNANRTQGFIWCNDDVDKAGVTPDEPTIEDDAYPAAGIQDCGYDPDGVARIGCKRDLEDFARLHLQIKGIEDQITSGQIKVGLKFKNITAGDPQIRIYKAVENDGGGNYLKDEVIANQQLAIPYGVAVKNSSNLQVTVDDGASPFILPLDFWAGLTSTNSKKYLLFEGCKAGTGKLVMVFYKSDGVSILGESSLLYLELKSAHDMKRAGVRSAMSNRPWYPRR
jgi:hypothetical protein